MAQLAQTTQAALSGQSKTVTVTVTAGSVILDFTIVTEDAAATAALVTTALATPELASTALGVPVEVLTGQLPVIATLRDAASIDPGTFARDVGLTIGRLERIERGTERPHSDTLDLIATRLGVEVDALSAKPAPPHHLTASMYHEPVLTCL